MALWQRHSTYCVSTKWNACHNSSWNAISTLFILFSPKCTIQSRHLNVDFTGLSLYFICIIHGNVYSSFFTIPFVEYISNEVATKILPSIYALLIFLRAPIYVWVFYWKMLGSSTFNLADVSASRRMCLHSNNDKYILRNSHCRCETKHKNPLSFDIYHWINKNIALIRVAKEWMTSKR